jgi:hypothetical protein
VGNEIADPVVTASSFHPGRSARNHLRVVATSAGLPLARADEVLVQVGLATVARRHPTTVIPVGLLPPGYGDKSARLEAPRLPRSPWNFGGGPMLDQAASSLVGVTAVAMVWSRATRSAGRCR